MSDANWTDEAFNDKTKGKVIVFFRPVQVKNNIKSREAQRPIFEEKIFIKKIVPGTNECTIDRPMREGDVEEFAAEWERWLKTKENRIPGTPLDMWHSISDTQKAEFKALNIFTVEQFADLPDSLGSKIMGFNGLREKARVFIASGKDAELVGRIRAEARQEVDAMKLQMEEMRAMLDELTKPKPEPVGA